MGESYTLKVRRYDPESGQPAYWHDYDVDLDPERSVLDGILQIKDREDASLAIRCSCRAAICGSCGVRINGKASLACNTRISEAAARGRDGAITVEPMGNMPVIKDLIVDMDAVHWKKVQRVVPWLLPDGPPPEREYIVPAEAMIDVTQSMACIHCGVCVAACLSLEVDPEFIGPAALAKAYRFVGDPRDGATEERLHDLAEDPHGIYDCTHCFACIEVCPKDVAPMSQIMRLRRRATGDYEIKDGNNGYGHEKAFVTLVEKYGTLHEAQLLPRSFGEGSLVKGQLTPSGAKQLTRELPTAARGLMSGKVSPKKALVHPKLPDQKQVRRIFKEIESKDERLELNLYIVGESGAEEEGAMAEGGQEEVRLAYWPGCVSRGFTPELHGSVAKVAPLLDLELVELDRANCCGAGVIAEHNQELVDTLNARTFAMAQDVEGAAGMMNICSTCQGAQSECQERLDASTAYRKHINTHLSDESLALRAQSGLVEQELPLAARRGGRAGRAARARRAAARGAAHRAVLRLLHRPPDQAAGLLGPPRARPVHRAADRGAGRRAGGLRRGAQVLRVPPDHDEPHDLAAPGRQAPRRRDRRRRGLPRHALPALPPEPGHAAAGGGQASSSATSTSPCCTCRSSWASRWASSPRSSA